MEDLAHVMYDTRSAFFSNDSTKEPIIVSDESEDEEPERHATQTDSQEQPEDTSVPPPPSPTTSKIRDSFIPTKLKELPSKITELSGDVKELHKHVQSILELPGNVHDILIKMETLTSTIYNIASQVAKLKTLQWKPPVDFLDLPSQVVTDTLNRFATHLKNASHTAGASSVPSVDQAGTSPVKGKKNTNQATISQLFQRKMAKDAEKANLKQPTFQSPFSPSPSSSSPQTKGEPIKEDRRKETMSSKDDEEEEIERGEHVHLTAEKIQEQKRIEESFKTDLAEHNVERVEELIDLMGYYIVE
ncbi:hypothetical protein Tco_0920543, partial [Tanacetum coccineum]